ncbi:hypothetical protein BDV93DRAFT_563040 [Ceratobasidium sp. AG-I]|nr:hypothetical protein BDV93DRAFT_563040 [Ceratobasidium sp. AG-I]
MPDWITVSGVITNVATALDLSYRYAPQEMIVGKDAGTILKEAKQVLRDAVVVLEDHRDVLPLEQYEKFKLEYRNYNWQITDESQEHRAVKDALIKQSRILRELYSKHDTHQKRAYTLLRDVESYQTDVLSASRKAAPQEPQFPDEEPNTSEPSHSKTSATPFTSWFSIFGNSPSTSPAESGTASPRTVPCSDVPGMITEGQGFIVAITHIPQIGSSSADLGSGETQASPGNNNIYRRMISFEGSGKRIDIIDPKLHSLDPRNTSISEDSMRAMTQLGERLLAEHGLQIPEGSPVTNVIGETTSMESTIQKFRQMSVVP